MPDVRGVLDARRRLARMVGTLSNWRPWKIIGRGEHGGLPGGEDPYLFLGWSLPRLRLATIIALLLVTLTQPVRGRFGMVLEFDILLYATFNVISEAFRQWLAAMRSIIWIPIVDLPVAVVIYGLGAAPGGLLFVPLFLDVITAAASMTVRGSLLYTALVAGLTLVIDPTFPLWPVDAGEPRRLASRLIILVVTALGTAILTQRLRLEQVNAQASRNETERRAELERVRTEFIAGISHDLRTPLTGARAGLGMLETSVQDRLRPDEQELIGSVRRNVRRLGRLIDDLITFNQLEASALQLARAPLDVRALVPPGAGRGQSVGERAPAYAAGHADHDHRTCVRAGDPSQRGRHRGRGAGRGARGNL